MVRTLLVSGHAFGVSLGVELMVDHHLKTMALSLTHASAGLKHTTGQYPRAGTDHGELLNGGESRDHA